MGKKITLVDVIAQVCHFFSRVLIEVSGTLKQNLISLEMIEIKNV